MLAKDGVSLLGRVAQTMKRWADGFESGLLQEVQSMMSSARRRWLRAMGPGVVLAVVRFRRWLTCL